MSNRTCMGCDAVIVPGPRERHKRKWCSEPCRQRANRRAGHPGYVKDYAPRCSVKYLDCEACGRVFTARSSRRFCGAACAKVGKAADARLRYAEDPETHKERVRAARASMTDEQWALTRASAQEWVRRNGGRAAVKTVYDQVRRARLLGVEFEQFKPHEVFDRDGWVCGICGESIDRGLAHPDPFSVSLDHVVPVSLGGPHTRANTRPAHLSCNIRRGNRLEVPDGWSWTGAKAC